MKNIAIGIVDAQRGFMPAEEGRRLHADGFGELPIEDGQAVIEPNNQLLQAAARHHLPAFTTQDWHPRATAHFSAEPDYDKTWPVHCVAGTDGAKLHPGLRLPDTAVRFIKGFVNLQPGETDTSYSGYYANCNPGTTLPEWLSRRGVEEVWLGGLALSHCVGETAVDLAEKAGLKVAVALDATRSVSPESEAVMLARLQLAGVEMATTAELLDRLKLTEQDNVDA